MNKFILVFLPLVLLLSACYAGAGVGVYDGVDAAVIVEDGYYVGGSGYYGRGGGYYHGGQYHYNNGGHYNGGGGHYHGRR